MKRRYLPILTLGALAALHPLSAQTAGGSRPHGPNIEERLSKMKEKLALTDDQVTKLKAAFEEQKTKLDPIFDDDTLSKEQKREKAKPIAEETKAKVDAVLTDEQRAKADQFRKERGEKRSSKKDQ